MIELLAIVCVPFGMITAFHLTVTLPLIYFDKRAERRRKRGAKIQAG